MLALGLKIALAFFACVVAVLGVSDLKTVQPAVPPDDRSWARRITRIGVVKIVCALATLILIALNEAVNYEASFHASRRAAEQARNLQSKIDQSRRALAVNIAQLRLLSRTNGYLVTSLDGTLFRAGLARVPPEQIDSVSFPLKFENGANLIPKRGDSLEWSFACQMGPTPMIPSAQQDNSCAQASYGRLMANSSAFILTQESGRRSYFGSRSTGGQMTYRSPAEGSLCPGMAARLKQMGCQLEITVMREARWKYEEMTKQTGEDKIPTTDDELQDACRRYEALFGDSCEAANDL